MKRLLFCLFLSAFSILQLLPQPSSHRVTSPDENLVFEINLDSSGSVNYSVSYLKRPVILLSEMGLNGWDKNFIQAGVAFNISDTIWRPVYGERSLVRDNYNSMIVTLLKEGRPRDGMQIEVRAYNEGVAFRYYFPEHPEGGRDINIREEYTGFTMPVGTKAWFTPRAQGRYSLLPLENWPGESERPLVLELSNGMYVCLAEAEMVDYSRTRFALHREKPNTIICSMYGQVDLTRPFGTPWRVIMAADDPGRFIENNDIILNLNPPTRVANSSWIKPGKVMRETTLSANGAREIVDFAVKRNLQYIHFDAGWYGYEYIVGSDATTVTVDPGRNPESDLDLQKAIRYADENGIGVILYVNQRALFRQIDELLPLFKKWGVRGIKFGFVHVGSHRWTTWMHDAVKKCADYNMLVNIHDEYRPTGFSRTWPNLMTQEGIYGNEEMPDATHNTVLPFTRFIAGAADYTVCYYHRPEFKESLRKSQTPRILKTTSAHQLALPVIYYSPLQYMYWYDRPSDSHDEPELEFFDRVPVVWDETRVLHGEIGKYISIARREGDEWFIGTITNNDEREVKIPLNFLEEGRKYEASVYFDDPGSGTRTKVGIRRISVDASSVISTRLYESGGQAVWIRPEN